MFTAAGCSQPSAGRPAAPIAGAGLSAEALQGPAFAEKFDMASYVTLTTRALGEAIQAGDARTIERFLIFADGMDPEPAATREIADAALQTSGVAAARLPGGLRQALERVATGKAALQALTPTAKGIVFPRDEGDHPFALTEWWYVNGHLQESGPNSGRAGSVPRRFGYEFTLFKVGALLHWAHVAVTDQQGQRFLYTRDYIPNSQIEASQDGLACRYGPYRLAKTASGAMALTATFGDQTLELALGSQKIPLLINGDGKIDMPEGKDSWYYSQTRLAATGALTQGTARTEVTGLTWLDHQWGPFFVSGLLDRWDWFSLQFEDGTEYNLFGFRTRNGQPRARYVNRSGTDGKGTMSRRFTLDRLAWWQSPRTHLHYTTAWRVTLPDAQETIEIKATNTDQELARRVPFLLDPLPNYWEGSMTTTKRLPDGRLVPGVAYCEHFGFTRPQD